MDQNIDQKCSIMISTLYNKNNSGILSDYKIKRFSNISPIFTFSTLGENVLHWVNFYILMHKIGISCSTHILLSLSATAMFYESNVVILEYYCKNKPPKNNVSLARKKCPNAGHYGEHWVKQLILF